MQAALKGCATCESLVTEISSVVVDAVVAHAREAAPAECCGLLLGTGNMVMAAARTRNIANDPTRRFEIDPQDHTDVRRDARRRGLAVLGFYHSHPRSPAVPSPTDLAEASYPDHLYLIVGLAAATPDVGLFRLEGGNFRATGFVTVG
jgi:proteasome lid subunit RPN8/RPN11